MASPMTPEHARNAIDATEGATDYTWSDAHHALETIAGMKEEWGVEYTGRQHGGRHVMWCQEEDSDPDSESQARHEYRILKKRRMEPRLVRRYVTQHEEINNER